MIPGEDFVGVATPFFCHDGEGRLLFQKRGEDTRDESGRWDSGSGQLEKGLSLEENVRKEVKEELGVECEIEERLPPHSIFREQNGEKTHWLVIPFFVKADSDSVQINEPEKISELRWAEIGKFPKPLHKGFEYTFNEYKDQFDQKLGKQ